MKGASDYMTDLIQQSARLNRELELTRAELEEREIKIEKLQRKLDEDGSNSSSIDAIRERELIDQIDSLQHKVFIQ
jgi:hypothetical protein